MKLYFIKDNIFSMTKEQIIEYLKENNISELTAFEAEKIKVEQFFYCKIHGMSERDNMTCGVNWCSQYSPKNRKSGCCKKIGNFYDAGKSVIFTVDDIKNNSK